MRAVSGQETDAIGDGHSGKCAPRRTDTLLDAFKPRDGILFPRHDEQVARRNQPGEIRHVRDSQNTGQITARTMRQRQP